MKPIVGIGELLWDVYPDGRKVAGGAPFNFAFHCHQLGHPAVIASRVGDDDLGRELREEVRRLGLSDEYIQTDRDHPTGTVKVTLDASKVPTYAITQDVAWDYIGADGDVMDEGFAHDVSAICFGTLALRSATSRFSILNLVRDRAWMPVALRVFDVNIRKPHVPSRQVLQDCIHHSTWIKASDEDLAFVGSRLETSEDDPLRIHIVTRGRQGFEVRTEIDDEPILHRSAVPSNVVDTVGAGDAFTAAMVCLHLEGRPLHDCARFANHYAARVCEHQGATPKIERAEVERAAFGSR